MSPPFVFGMPSTLLVLAAILIAIALMFIPRAFIGGMVLLLIVLLVLLFR